MPGLPQMTFADEAQVFIGGKEVQAHHIGRGHTNGDAVIYFRSERVLHTGDRFVNGGAPFIDYSAHGSIVEWDKTIENALKYWQRRKELSFLVHATLQTKGATPRRL